MSRPQPIAPSVTESQYGECDPHEVLSHPAFGVITMTTVTGGDPALFGSDLRHDQRVCIRIHDADLKRDLSHDWIHGSKLLFEFEMSAAQFSRFIVSNGRGDGTPITIKHKASQPGLMWVPAIKPIETKNETFRREIEAAAKKRAEGVQAAVKQLSNLIEGGKLSKTELRRLVREIENNASGFATSVSYVVGQANEALERATSDAKIEVQAVVSHAQSELAKLAAAKAELSGKPAPVEIENESAQ